MAMRERDEDWPERDEDWTDEENLALIEQVFAFLKAKGINIPYTVNEQGIIGYDEEAFENGLLWLREYIDKQRQSNDESYA